MGNDRLSKDKQKNVGPLSRTYNEVDSRFYIKGSPAKETLLPICFKSGSGEFLVDVDGNKYIDFSAGVVVPLGHCNRTVIEAIQDACMMLEACEDYASTPRSDLTLSFSQLYPGEFGGIQYYSAGTEAVEASLRFARAATGKAEFIGFNGSYHGKTLGSVSLATIEDYNGQRAPGFYQVPYAYCYRCEYGMTYPKCELYCIEMLKEFIKRQTKGCLAGIVVETIQGFAGAIIPPRGFLKGVKELCDEMGALLVVDEILTGVGRTGTLFAFEQFGIKPDIVTVGKGLGNGIPITATIIEKAYIDKVSHVEGGTSCGGNPVSCSAAFATIQAIVNNNVENNARDLGHLIISHLQELSNQYECIGDVRCLGCLAAIEFVKDRQTKEPDPAICRTVYQNACKKGLLTTLLGHIIRLTPPLVTNKDTVEKARDIVEASIREALKAR